MNAASPALSGTESEHAQKVDRKDTDSEGRSVNAKEFLPAFISLTYFFGVFRLYYRTF